MKYLVGLILIAAILFAVRRFAAHIKVLEPFWTLGFFKHHYLLAGIFLSFFFPVDYERVFDPVRIIAITFSLCWIGLYYGCGLELRAHQRFSPRVILTNIMEPVILFVIIVLLGAVYQYYSRGDREDLSIVVLIAIFCSFNIFRRRGIFYRHGQVEHHPVLDNLLPIGNIFPVVALAVAGKVFSDSPPITLLGRMFPGTVSFFVLQLLTGILGGVLLNMLILAARNKTDHALIMTGGAALIGGIATSLSFSPLFTGMIAGAFLINSTLKRLEVLDILNKYHDNIEKIFIFCLGTFLPPLLTTLKLKTVTLAAGALALFLFRAAFKYLLCTFWISKVTGVSSGAPVLWIGLTGQGILATAAAVECAYNVSRFDIVFFLLMTILIANQLTIGLYVWRTERMELETNHA